MREIRAKLRPADLPEVESNRVGFGIHATEYVTGSHELGKLNGSIQQCIPDLAHNKIYHFFSCGHWSTHELLAYLLNFTGPAEVLISVWSISETAARMLASMLENKHITSLKAVLDYRSKNRHPGAHQLAMHSFSQLRTFPCHAKLTVIRNDHWAITINGSANYTNNPRPEAGYVDTTPETAAFYAKYIEQLLDNSNPFE